MKDANKIRIVLELLEESVMVKESPEWKLSANIVVGDNTDKAMDKARSLEGVKQVAMVTGDTIRVHFDKRKISLEKIKKALNIK